MRCRSYAYPTHPNHSTCFHVHRHLVGCTGFVVAVGLYLLLSLLSTLYCCLLRDTHQNRAIRLSTISLSRGPSAPPRTHPYSVTLLTMLFSGAVFVTVYSCTVLQCGSVVVGGGVHVSGRHSYTWPTKPVSSVIGVYIWSKLNFLHLFSFLSISHFHILANTA